MLDRLTNSLDFQTTALALRSERQRIIASNIANADTPGYQARDMDFAQALRDATGTGGPSIGGAMMKMTAGGGAGTQPTLPALAATQPAHISTASFAAGTSGTAAGGRPLLYATPSQTNLDRNTVDMDRERASFAENTVHYEAALRFINGSVKTMLSAITGQA